MNETPKDKTSRRDFLKNTLIAGAGAAAALAWQTPQAKAIERMYKLEGIEAAATMAGLHPEITRWMIGAGFKLDGDFYELRVKMPGFELEECPDAMRAIVTGDSASDTLIVNGEVPVRIVNFHCTVDSLHKPTRIRFALANPDGVFYVAFRRKH